MNGLEHALQLLAEANSFACDRVSPSQSGASKRKSRPVKRIINEEITNDGSQVVVECAAMPLEATEPLLASIQQQITGYSSEGSHREEDEGASSEVLSTGSAEENMEQSSLANADLLRRVAEALSMGQLNGAGGLNLIQQQLAATKDLSFDVSALSNGNGLLAPQISPLFTAVENNYASPERLLQMFSPLNFGLTTQNGLVTSPHNNGLLQTPLMSPSPNFLQSLITAQTANASNVTNQRKPENRPPVVSQTLKATKRRLNDEDRSRGDAGQMNSDERIDMSDLEAFAQTFKKQRIKFGFTQGDVGVALGKRYGTDFSQTTISRFEALNLSFKNMCKLRPLLKEWLADVEQAIEGGATITDLIERRASATASIPQIPDLHVTTSIDVNHTPSSAIQSVLNRDQHVKRRRKRTNLDLNQRASLDAFFNINPRPDHDRMTEIANSLELDRDVVRVWFCNRRQKMRRVDEPTEGEVATPSVSPLFSTLQTLSTFEQLQEAAKHAAHVCNDDSDGTSRSPDTPTISLDGITEA